MGAWQVRALAGTAVTAAIVIIGSQSIGSPIQHALNEGAHARAELGEWVIEWRLEPQSIHARTGGCAVFEETSR
jgi:hypothetical protein